MRRLAAIFSLFALVLTSLTAPAATQAIVQDIGGAQLLVEEPANPRAVAFVFAGGDGMVAFNSAAQISRMGNNFLIRTRPLWLAQGFTYATLGSSSSLMGQRHTAAYDQTIARAIDVIHSRANAPVWLIGTSQGSIAAANGAAHLPGRVAGVVLTSSVAGRSVSGETVFDSDLGAIAVPALVVANRGDTCASAAPSHALQILAALTRAPKKEVIYVESHQTQSDPCEALSPHGYLGIEGDVAQRIADWIRATPTR